MLSRRLAAIGATALLLASAAPAKKAPVSCPGGRFLIAGRRLIPGSGNGTDAITIAPPTVSVASGCPSVTAVLKATPGGMRVHAVWPASACAGLKGRAQLKARILPGCRRLSGALVARKFKKAFTDVPLSTGCGDGVVDPGLGEECDGADCSPGRPCTDHCLCTGDTTTTVPGVGTPTTTLPPVSTRCCQAVGACFDANPADAQATCAALPAASHASVAPAGEVCDGVAGMCGAVKKVGPHCCQCPVSTSQGFPHPQYCFDTSITSCGQGPCEQVPGACGPDSQTCGGP